MIEETLFVTLNEYELQDTNGGLAISTAIGVVTAVAAIITAGTAAYNIAKDAAYEARSSANAKRCYEGNCNGNCKL